MADENFVILIGRLGEDPITRHTKTGKVVSTLSVATKRRFSDKDIVDWHRVTLWGSENVLPFLKKGKQVYVNGNLIYRVYEDKDGNKVRYAEISASWVMLLGDKGAAKDEPTTFDRGTQYESSTKDDKWEVSDDDVPF